MAGPQSRLITLSTASVVWSCLGLAALDGAPFAAGPPVKPAAPALLDEMDSPRPVLKLLNGGPLVRLVQQTVVGDVLGAASGVERAIVLCPAGRSAQLAYRLPDASIIDELQLAAVVRCNRPGVRLAVRAKLPRSVNPETGRPFELTVPAAQASSGEGFQRLEFGQLPRELARIARVARAQHQVSVDTRGGVVTHLILLVPGGTGPTELLVDKIEMRTPSLSTGAAVSTAIEDLRSAGITSPESTGAAVPDPVIARVLQWQGESFEQVRRMGFDAIQLSQPATPSQLVEASRSGLRLICPSPAAIHAPGSAEPPARTPTKPAVDYGAVLAWDLGVISSDEDLSRALSVRHALGQSEPLSRPPTLVRPLMNLRGSSRVADILVLDRPLAGASFSQVEFASWLHQKRHLARPGAQFWAAIDTHNGVGQAAQLAALRGTKAELVAASFSDLTAWVSTAMAVRPRGYLFKSEAPLTGNDHETRRRAIALELTNMRLELLAPWLASGKPATAASSSRPGLAALALKTERSHLLAPMDWDPAAGASGDGRVAFLASGIDESANAYLISLGQVERLRAQRVAGGVRVTVDQLPPGAFILITQDGLAFSQVQRRLRQQTQRAARLLSELAALEVGDARGAVRQLSADRRVAVEADSALRRVAAWQATGAAARGAGDYARSCAADEQCLAELAALKHRLTIMVAPVGPPGAWPGIGSWSALPVLAGVARSVDLAPAGGQPLPGGAFEDLKSLLRSGWRHWQHPVDGVATSVQLSPDSPHQGRLCLQMEATAQVATEVLATPQTPPVWITSPPIPAESGRIIEISGRVRAPKPLLGAPGELLIFDSIGGEQSALRIRHAPAWEPFRLVRAAAPGASMQLTIALAGLGRVELDSLEFRTIPYVAAAVQSPTAANKR